VAATLATFPASSAFCLSFSSLSFASLSSVASATVRGSARRAHDYGGGPELDQADEIVPPPALKAHRSAQPRGRGDRRMRVNRVNPVAVAVRRPRFPGSRSRRTTTATLTGPRMQPFNAHGLGGILEQTSARMPLLPLPGPRRGGRRRARRRAPQCRGRCSRSRASTPATGPACSTRWTATAPSSPPSASTSAHAPVLRRGPLIWLAG
jgi:hypothetical protein